MMTSRPDGRRAEALAPSRQRSRRFGGAGAVVAMLALAVAGGAALAQESAQIQIRFEEGAESRYEVSLELDVTSVAGLKEQKVSTGSKTSMKLAMDTVAHAPAGEPPSLAVTFSGLELDQTIDGPAGEIKVEIRGENVKVEKRSRTLIDTSREEDAGRGSAILAEFAFVGVEGTLVMERSGRVAEVKGPRKFTDFLAASSGPGLFVLEAPEGKVAVGESWPAEPAEIRKLKGLDLSANPIIVRTSFTLEGFEEKDGRKLARIAVKAPLKEGGGA